MYGYIFYIFPNRIVLPVGMAHNLVQRDSMMEGPGPPRPHESMEVGRWFKCKTKVFLDKCLQATESVSGMNP